VKHLHMQEREHQQQQQRAAHISDDLVGETLSYGAAADDNLLMTDAKTDTQKHPDLERAEEEEARWTLPPDEEDRLWAERERALEHLELVCDILLPENQP
jgi:hypothetical protein